MTIRRDSLYAFVLAALAVVGIVVLVALNKPVPGPLETLAIGAAFAGAGLGTPHPAAAPDQSAPAPSSPAGEVATMVAPSASPAGAPPAAAPLAPTTGPVAP